MEADLLAAYFEELSAYRGEEAAKIRRQQDRASDGGDWHTDQVFDDEDDDE